MRLIFVSNRLPVTVEKKRGKLTFKQSVGGLATGLQSFYQSYDSIWIGWDGLTSESLNPEEALALENELKEKYRNHPVPLSRNDVKLFYHGFSNRTIWPLFHYFQNFTVYEQHLWDAYIRVNAKFCDAITETAGAEDMIWIHDYQLMLLPRMVRERLPEARIGFFLHIPFPSFEIFRLLPWRREILQGLLGADLVGFHTYDYVRHFLSSVRRLLGYDHTLGSIQSENRIVRTDVFPMGIDYEKYARACEDSKVKREIVNMKKRVGDRKVVLSVDRLDYTKGILHRLEAFDLFLRNNPRYQNNVTLILVAVPSRTGVETYVQLKRELDEHIGRLNGQYGTIDWVPVWYLYRSLPFHALTALYNIADVALVTPLRDGMNLIAKEFIAARGDNGGVLVLSGMAGAVHELSESVIVNPHNTEQVAAGIKQALEMPDEEQKRANRLMQGRLGRYNVEHWARDFIEGLNSTYEARKQLAVRKLTAASEKRLLSDYCAAPRRLLLLDYDGTLATTRSRPEEAAPDESLKEIIRLLGSDSRNKLVIISGRDRETLTGWFGGMQLGIGMVAEHGVWLKDRGRGWQEQEPMRDEWREPIRSVFEVFTDRTPGSLLEEKSYSLVWHYRMADPDLASVRATELREALLNLTENYNLSILEGDKIVEVKSAGIDKGTAVMHWLNREKWDFILAVGDDISDEIMYEVLPSQSYTIKVGLGASKARYNVLSVQDVHKLLKLLIGIESS
jgi:trehalose 6-phosphate synthase/phosphatase